MLIEEGKTSLLESEDEDDRGKLGRWNWNFDASKNLMWVRGRVGKIDGEKKVEAEAEVFQKVLFSLTPQNFLLIRTEQWVHCEGIGKII